MAPIYFTYPAQHPAVFQEDLILPYQKMEKELLQLQETFTHSAQAKRNRTIHTQLHSLIQVLLTDLKHLASSPSRHQAFHDRASKGVQEVFRLLQQVDYAKQHSQLQTSLDHTIASLARLHLSSQQTASTFADFEIPQPVVRCTQAVVKGAVFALENTIDTVLHPIERVVKPLCATAYHLDMVERHEDKALNPSDTSDEAFLTRECLQALQEQNQPIQQIASTLKNGPLEAKVELASAVITSALLPKMGAIVSKNFAKLPILPYLGRCHKVKELTDHSISNYVYARRRGDRALTVFVYVLIDSENGAILRTRDAMQKLAKDQGAKKIFVQANIVNLKLQTLLEKFCTIQNSQSFWFQKMPLIQPDSQFSKKKFPVFEIPLRSSTKDCRFSSDQMQAILTELNYLYPKNSDDT